MPDLLSILAAYVPPDVARAALRHATRAATRPEGPQSNHFPAAVLFADVSGFTPLTEALAQKGPEGAEELTRLLNGYFSHMIALIEAEGGEVVKFSGDALTAVFPAGQDSLGIATRRARQAAQAMQASMNKFALLETSVGPVALGMKIGVGAGDILAAQIGGVSDHWEYVIAGDPLRQVAQAEHLAQRGEIILSSEAEAVIAPAAVAPRPLLQPDWSRAHNPPAVEAMLRLYVPGIVIAWLSQELRAWLAVLRPMSVLFISVDGIDYAQPDAAEQLHAFLRAAQEIIYRYEGSINKLAVDDKGTIAIVLFGAPPYAHEDDPERALRCALDLQAMAEGQRLQLAIGATTGRVFAGPVGSETRREYTVMGDAVNLAARLMAVAGRGELRCDYETYRSARGKLIFEVLPPVHVKGKAGLIRIYRPSGEAAPDRREATSSAFVGRQAEMARLAACLDDLQAGRSRIVLIVGEAGIGKSRLVEELTRLMRESGVAGLLGRGRSIEQQTPYRAWRDIFTAYFDVENIEDPTERRRRIQAHAVDVVPDLIERIPLLNDVLLNLGLPESELTASLDTRLRHESLVSLLLALLRAWAAERPLVLILEDAHWLDSVSWDLAAQVARAFRVGRAPLLLVVVLRPLEGDMARAEPLSELEGAERIALESLSPDETVAVAAARLGVAEAALPEAIAQLIRARTGGNPFFAEELVHFLRDHGIITVRIEQGETRCLVSGDLAQAAQMLPDTIQGIVLSRVDRLPPEEQLTLKVAAVIGRTFAYTPLRDTLGEHMEISQRLLTGYLDDLDRRELTLLEAMEPELTYIFKHLITQEAAYETLLFAQRRQLHRSVALWYERAFGATPASPTTDEMQTPLAPYYPLLVYHWHQAEDTYRERHYARLAGKWAAAQFANVEAVGYFSRALELTPESERAARCELLLAREAVNDLRGEREAQTRDLAALASLVAELRDARRSAEVVLRQADYHEATSDYAAALEAVQRAVGHAAQAQDQAAEAEGYIAWGKVLWRQGDYDAARAPLERALALARAVRYRGSEAKSLYYLGNVYLYQGNYAAAQDHFRQALDIYRAEGHRQGEADSLNNLGVIQYDRGDFSSARDHWEQVLSINHTLGDRRGETMTLSNLGTVYCDLGDYSAARDYHRQALDLRRTIGDRWGEATSLVNLGLVYHGLGDQAAARAHCERALAIQREIGDRRGEGYSLTYLGHALAELGELEAAAEAYAQAMRLRHELGHTSLVMDDLAGLARAALARGEAAHARQSVEEILAWIEANSSAGIEYPFQVYLTCYRVLRATANDDPSVLQRADAILSKAHSGLMEQAAGISDPALRRALLENVRANREIVAVWQTRETSNSNRAAYT